MPKQDVALEIPALNAEQINVVLSKVNEHGSHWIWTGSNNRSGGRLMIAGVRYSARRLMWTIFHGKIPDNYMIAPSCGEWLCVNPNHLVCGNNLMIQSMSSETFAGRVDSDYCNSGHKRELGAGKCAICNREQTAKSKRKKNSMEDK